VETARLIAPANERIRQMALPEGASLVDLYPAFAGMTETLLGPDGLHPSETGYDMIAQTFFNAIRERLEGSPVQPSIEMVTKKRHDRSIEHRIRTTTAVVSGLSRTVADAALFGLFASLVLSAIACGSPSAPSQPPPPPSVNNTPPTITSFTLGAVRVEAGDDVDVTAVVADAETPIDQLTYDWSATPANGTFSGTGRQVRWKAPFLQPRTFTR
jgi:hypothetical protein